MLHTKHNYQTFDNLQADSSLIIHIPDKGRALVILNKNNYVAHSYINLPGDLNLQFKVIIPGVLKGFLKSGEMTKMETDLLTVQHSRIPVFFLSKVHKNLSHHLDGSYYWVLTFLPSPFPLLLFIL